MANGTRLPSTSQQEDFSLELHSMFHDLYNSPSWKAATLAYPLSALS
jgi:hypothetical protein